MFKKETKLGKLKQGGRKGRGENMNILLTRVAGIAAIV
jgi:hypothetical protein